MIALLVGGKHAGVRMNISHAMQTLDVPDMLEPEARVLPDDSAPVPCDFKVTRYHFCHYNRPAMIAIYTHLPMDGEHLIGILANGYEGGSCAFKE